MSITINGATNTLTAASGLTIAGNTAVTGTLSATDNALISGGVRINPNSGSSKAWFYKATDAADRYYLASNWVGSQENAGLPSWGVLFDSRVAGDVLQIRRAPAGGAMATVASFSSAGLDVTGTLSASGVTSVTDTTDATSTTAASLKTAGGLGVAKALYVGGAIYQTSASGNSGILTTCVSGSAAQVSMIQTGVVTWSLANQATTGLFSITESSVSDWLTIAKTTGVTKVISTTDSSSTSTGALVVSGGVGIAKKTYCGDNIVMASGKGIDFSATSDGSGTTTSEVLSDYEEGTWTATVKGSVTDPTTPVTATGYYTKIGRMVTAIFDISASDTTGAAGNIQIAGLPFTSLAVDPRNLGDMYFSRSSAACMAFLEPGSTTLTAVDASGNAVTHGSVGAGTFAAASITYFV